MPTFCRHGRLEENCPICSRKPRVKPGTVTGQAAARLAKNRAAGPPKRTSSGSSPGSGPSKRRTPRHGDLKVRRMQRSVEDGYEHELVPGIKASGDARRLAAELAFTTARLAELREDPPGLLGEVAAMQDAEEALWTLFLVAYLSPVEEPGDPFAAIAGARTPWAGGELPVLDGVPTGPRTAYDARRAGDTLAAYRARAERAGGQVAMLSAEAATPSRRFDRAFEQLALPRFPRVARYEFLLLAGGLGLLDIEPSSLLLAAAEPMDPALLAAKRIFGIGDAINLQRRAGALVTAAEVAPAALDLALVNWGRPEGERITAGSAAEEDADVRGRVERVLGVAEEDEAEAEAEADDGRSADVDD
ncbi:hypothetical protein NBH00_10360 [Paraconexibacter antarcticus]|uniref:Alpha-glutamyl/putrescinyl thymine pyrophosphorylase clade 3 domain-containing protein n=1 Tax=Paraconexibacter antarcticus TaxID=2949664 RepID=A0ABY5E0H1_9ACTN|nr:hypothetical protein [Paraconexibacter antarcticus]UTI66592.1 hypothetical protein NBH00_10360 [Paraconexibacter antarcticus]